MSKAQELKKAREDRNFTAAERHFDVAEDAESMDAYYDKILTGDDIEASLKEYEGNFDVIRNEFLEKTRIHSSDLPFLFFAVMLQCVRIYVIDRLTKIEKANSGEREKRLHDLQERIFSKFDNGEEALINPLYASFETIITTRGVPYDTAEDPLKRHMFKGANHRFSTLGHDPVLGLVFGTANILTSTISTNRKWKVATYNVVYKNELKRPVIKNPVPTSIMLNAARKRLYDDKKSVAAAVIKQLIHIATDVYSPCGITLPGMGLILSNTNVEKLTEYINFGDIIKCGGTAELSMFINTIISAVHGCILLLMTMSSLTRQNYIKPEQGK